MPEEKMTRVHRSEPDIEKKTAGGECFFNTNLCLVASDNLRHVQMLRH